MGSGCSVSGEPNTVERVFFSQHLVMRMCYHKILIYRTRKLKARNFPCHRELHEEVCMYTVKLLCPFICNGSEWMVFFSLTQISLRPMERFPLASQAFV